MKKFIPTSNAFVHVVVGIALVFISSLFLFMSIYMKVPETAVGLLSPALFPMTLAIILLVLSLLLMVKHWLKANESLSVESEPGQQDPEIPETDRKEGHVSVRPIVFMAASLVYLLIMPFAGFTLSTVVFLICIFHWIRFPWIKRISFIAGTLAVHYFFFDALLHIRFPAGLLG